MKAVREEPGRFVLLFQDEATFYRQPSQGWLWAHWGRTQPPMAYSNRSNTRMRVIGYLNATTGAVHSEETSCVTVERLTRSLACLSQWYAEAETIYLVWDNWPNHAHPKVSEAIGRQNRVKVLWLPTYAPWLNHSEKLWRWTRQRVTHAHPWSDDFRQFRHQVCAELARLAEGSPELLRYVGLST